MNTYLLYIKSHTEFPDYEEEVQAKTKEEALDYFYHTINRNGGDCGKEDLKPHMGILLKGGEIVKPF